MKRNLILLALAALVLPAANCDDNLGQGSPGAVSFRVSVAPNTVQATDASSAPTISQDGNLVCFASRAKNLAAPTSGFQEIFVRNRSNDTIQNVSRISKIFDPTNQADCFNPWMSSNGDWIVFESTGALTFSGPPTFIGKKALFLIDRLNLTLQRIPPVELDEDCTNASVSDNGLFIAFQTSASNVPGVANATGSTRVYVYDKNADTTTLISHSTGGATTICDRRAERPVISPDGGFVVFQSQSTNLTAEANPSIGFDGPARRIYIAANDGTGLALVSRASGAAGTPSDNHCGSPSVSRGGRYVAYHYQGGTMVPGATVPCVIRRDRDPGALASELVTTNVFMFGLFSTLQEGANTSISDDGQIVAYTGINAPVTDLQITVRDMLGGETVCSHFILTQGSTLLEFPNPSLSGDGRWVVWQGESDLEVFGDTNSVVDIFGFGPIR